MKGKAIYNPSGKAREYSYWATNFYNGCSADCSYCYCKKGPLSSVWSDRPVLKKSLVNENKALEIFQKEAIKNIDSLQEHGLFFNFTSDPFLPETIDLNMAAMLFCHANGIPVKALTKQTWWIGDRHLPFQKGAIGFSLTGCDSEEPGAGDNAERLYGLNYFHRGGFKTFASIEPIIDLHNSMMVIFKSLDSVDHYKIGILSGAFYLRGELSPFIKGVNKVVPEGVTIYWKESILKAAGVSRESLPEMCVDRDFKFWS